jgi:hypothetical protein
LISSHFLISQWSSLHFRECKFSLPRSQQPELILILSQIKPVHGLPTDSFKIHFNIIFPSTRSLPSFPFLQVSPTINLYIYLHPVPSIWYLTHSFNSSNFLYNSCLKCCKNYFLPIPYSSHSLFCNSFILFLSVFHFNIHLEILLILLHYPK